MRGRVLKERGQDENTWDLMYMRKTKTVVIGTVNLDFFGFFFIFSGTAEFCRRGTAWPGPARVARPAGAEVAGFARSRGTTWPGPARARAPSFARKGAASERARVASGVSRALFIVGIARTSRSDKRTTSVRSEAW